MFRGIVAVGTCLSLACVDGMGSGGSGDPGGIGGSGGSGGIGGSGGDPGCAIDDWPACNLAGPSLRVEVPELWGVFLYFDGVGDFDFPGIVVSQEPGDREDEQVLIIEGAGGVRVSLSYVAPPMMAVPATPGTALTLHYHAVYDNLAERQANRQVVRILDVAGRILWAADVHENSAALSHLPGLAVVSTAARCAAPVQTGFGEALYSGSDWTVRYRDGEETSVPLGEIVTVAGSGVEGKLYLAGAFLRPRECHDGAFPRSSVQTVFATTEPGPAGPGCALDADCGSGGYCERTGGTCDSPGRCVARPTICPQDGLPVCACDGKVYEGACAANQAGVDTAAGAACEGHYGCGTFACREGEEACVRNLAGAVPQCLPLSLAGCESNDCGCVDGMGIWAGCTCNESAPGRFDVGCER